MRFFLTLLVVLSNTAFGAPLSNTIEVGSLDISNGGVQLTAELGDTMAGMPVVSESVVRDGAGYTLVRQSTDGESCFTSEVGLGLFGVKLVVFTDRVESTSFSSGSCEAAPVCADGTCTSMVSDEASVRDFLFGSGAPLRGV